MNRRCLEMVRQVDPVLNRKRSRHKITPDGSAELAAGGSRHGGVGDDIPALPFRRSISMDMSHPDSGRQLRRIADKPGVTTAAGGSGLAMGVRDTGGGGSCS